jgi:glycosyltransferase involved in cell wall biosynthesis
MHLPLSFVMPNYNKAGTVGLSIRSIVEGNYQPGDEIIVVDDGSPDQSVTAIRAAIDGIANARLIEHPANRGGSAARNTGVAAAANNLIFMLDSDNLLLPGTIDLLIERLIKARLDACGFGLSLEFATDAQAEDIARKMALGEPFQATGSSYDDRIYGVEEALGHSTVPGNNGNYLYTKASWAAAGGYPEGANALDTWMFALMQAATGARLGVAPRTAYLHRVENHAQSYWFRFADRHDVDDTAARLIEPLRPILTPGFQAYLDGPERKGWFANKEACPASPKWTGEFLAARE